MSDTSRSMTFTIEGDVSVRITVTEDGAGGLVFDLAVIDDTGLTADLNGLFFDFGDASLVDGLLADGAEITNTAFEYDGVDNLGGGVNIKGDLVNDTDRYDAGVRLGTSGMAKDDIQTTSFTLTHETEALTLEDVANMDFAVRLTSVGEIDGDRDGSLKWTMAAMMSRTTTPCPTIPTRFPTSPMTAASWARTTNSSSTTAVSSTAAIRCSTGRVTMGCCNRRPTTRFCPTRR